VLNTNIENGKDYVLKMVKEHDVKKILRQDGWDEQDIHTMWEKVRSEMMYEPRKGSGVFYVIGHKHPRDQE